MESSQIWHILSLETQVLISCYRSPQDGTTQIGGESGLSTNAQGQVTNNGRSTGITIIPSTIIETKGNKTTDATEAKGNSATSAIKPKGTGSGVRGLAALLNALLGASSRESKNGTAAAKEPVAVPAEKL
jgi:LDH2 family malate/lactate/ureidoglycolate dehydrogenase